MISIASTFSYGIVDKAIRLYYTADFEVLQLIHNKQSYKVYKYLALAITSLIDTKLSDGSDGR